jgi:hypothetical protein
MDAFRSAWYAAWEFSLLSLTGVFLLLVYLKLGNICNETRRTNQLLVLLLMDQTRRKDEPKTAEPTESKMGAPAPAVSNPVEESNRPD